MDYKKVTAIVRASSLEVVETRLKDHGVKGISVTQVKGFGEYRDFLRRDWSVTYARIEIFVRNDMVDGIVDVITTAAHTGQPGDGIVAVLPVERFQRIRECGAATG